MSSDSGAQPPDAKAHDDRQDAKNQPVIGTASTSEGDKNPCNSASSSKHEKPKRDWLDIANFLILLGAFLAAITAAFEADRLANLTGTSLSDARIAAAKAHEDNIAALARADHANQTSRDTERRQLRAYRYRKEVGLSGDFTAIVVFANGGQTPANEVRIKHWTRSLPYPLKERIEDITKRMPPFANRGTQTFVFRDDVIQSMVPVKQAPTPELRQSNHRRNFREILQLG
jgi:hypothetical protein